MTTHKKYGYWSTLESISLIDISISAGFDFVIFDMEHGTHNINSISNAILLLKKSGCKSYVRIPQNSYSLIQRIHDIGSDGILFPMLHSKEQIKIVREATKSEPNGKLGFNPFVKRFDYQNKTSTNNFSCIGMIEDLDLFEEALNLYLTFELDGCYVGAYDMNIKAGYSGEMMDESFLNKLDYCYKKLDNHKNEIESFGMNFINDPESSNLIQKPNFKNSCLFVDSGIIFKDWEGALTNQKNDF